jgi:hypothetical protein
MLSHNCRLVLSGAWAIGIKHTKIILPLTRAVSKYLRPYAKGASNLESSYSQNTLVINYITLIYALGPLCSTDVQQVSEEILYK